jgi:uncharacterized protein with von Willebrand factor type A (vWA) domain
MNPEITAGPEGPALLRNLLVFGRLLRSLGLDVHVGRMLDVTEALRHVDLGSRDDVYHTCRTLMVHRRDDLAIFDRAFEAFWRQGGAHVDEAAGKARSGQASKAPDTAQSDRNQGFWDARRLPPAAEEAVEHEREDATAGDVPAWSDAGALASKDFAEYTEDEIAVARLALARLSWTPGERRTRRWVSGRGSRVDVRRALARSLRTGGEVVKLPSRRRRTRPRPLVLICDVSGSMERYSRMLLHFVHAIGQRHRRVEAFLFSTELTRITSALRFRRLDTAVTAVSRSVPDWSGGTRTGEALRQLNQRWTRRVLHGGAVVLLISDGWDRGDPHMLRDQIARLQRSCHRLIWLNPLLGTEHYAPLTRGLKAALPFVDDFLPARTLNNLADLAVHLNALATPVRETKR